MSLRLYTISPRSSASVALTLPNDTSVDSDSATVKPATDMILTIIAKAL